MTTSAAHTPLADLANPDVTTEPDRPDGPGRPHAAPAGRYVIGLAADGTPLWLTAVTARGRGRRVPAVVVSGAVTLEEVVERSALLNLLELSPDAAVVTDPAGGAVLGVLERATIDAYLWRDHFPGGSTRVAPWGSAPGSVTGDDGCLCGAHRTPHAHVVCAAEGCGRVNPLYFYDPEDPPLCRGPGQGAAEHPLALSPQRS